MADVAAPTAVNLGATSVTAAAVGELHTCALGNGAVACRGVNEKGQLGPTPLKVGSGGTHPLTLPTAAKASILVAGQDFTCAYVDADTRVYCWGVNDQGQCGNGTLVNAAAPAAVKGLDGTVLQLGAGQGTACALLDTHEVFCWGASWAGQVGNGAHQGTGLFTAVPNL